MAGVGRVAPRRIAAVTADNIAPRINPTGVAPGVGGTREIDRSKVVVTEQKYVEGAVRPLVSS